MQDWVCEVHNDCPGDNFPGNYIHSLNDNRFILKNHPVNLGATATFNLAYQNAAEPYISILEDDNWWEPDFLQEMVNIMDNFPDVTMAWSNMYIWDEVKPNIWENTNTLVSPAITEDCIFTALELRQAMGALHSNGVMLIRGSHAAAHITPNNCEFDLMESVRERSIPFPVYFAARPLANFSRTLQTHRSGDALVWTSGQLLLLASFITASDDIYETFSRCLAHYRRQKPSPVASFYLANLFLIHKPELYRLFTLADWLLIIKWLLRNLFRLNFVKKYISLHRELYNYLMMQTKGRYKGQHSNK